MLGVLAVALAASSWNILCSAGVLLGFIMQEIGYIMAAVWNGAIQGLDSFHQFRKK